MKKIFYILSIYAICLFSSCSDNNSQDATPKILTGTALVNGAVFNTTKVFATKNDPTNKNIWSVSLMNIVEKQETVGKIVYTQQISVAANITKLGVYSYDSLRKTSNSSLMQEGEWTANVFTTIRNETKNISLGFKAMRVHKGMLTITKITEKTAEGMFSFEGTNVDIDTREEAPIAITNGKFNVTFE